MTKAATSVWTDWVDQSRKLLEQACGPQTGTSARCAEVVDQLRHIEQLEQWALAFFSGMAFVAAWRFVEMVWNRLRPPDPDELAPEAHQDRALLSNGGHHDA
ncbi:hypothetical protein [Novosphingobium sp. 9U]|uniref:hypothetical protein n=1 Tax=Novosphingobium sp. 9U TaxID=2653158 RepID=UPI0012F2C220|nr:hypothetical protein [Novosphingobium sp. 9U]VWX51094.1 hypothetical protein NOVOSPHI9U_370087 [Novosphingobium sp. 9U]